RPPRCFIFPYTPLCRSNPTRRPVQMVLLGDRERHPALGLAGGEPGATAQVVLDTGERVHLKSVSHLAPGASVTISFAGGGGFGRDRKSTRLNSSHVKIS